LVEEVLVQRVISVQNAKIKTATVEIKALTINAHQVTQAVFRQFPRSPLFDLSAPLPKLRGLPWGRVNHHFPECKQIAEHHHVVWQTGNELRRDEVFRDLAHYPGPIKAELQELLTYQWSYRQLLAGKTTYCYGYQSIGFRNFTFTLFSHPTRKLAEWQEEWEIYSSGRDPGDLPSMIQGTYDQYELWRNRMGILLDEIEELDQLFIAAG
jgi:hypothetical protein